MPLGAFVADQQLMSVLTDNPVLGHITTFGGHPVCCAAGLAALETLLDEEMMNEVKRKEELFKSLLVHKKIRAIRSFGLWLALEFDSFETNKKIIDHCIANGVLTDWFLFASNCLRISPPLIISEEQIKKAAAVLLKSLQPN
jgi:acetylornithine/succinyldiaminopimelate/putrescine aminotransferase